MTKEIFSCTACSDLYDPDSPSNAIDYAQLATFVFPRDKDESHTHSNDHAVLESEEDVITHQDLFIEQEEEISTYLELDFSSEDEDNNSHQQEELCVSQDSPIDECVRIPNDSNMCLTYPNSLTLFLTLFLIGLQRMSNDTLLTLLTAILFVVILSISEHQSRTNISLSKANVNLLILKREQTLQS
ncbi:hypothetical protein C9374_005726 [Naegleria lovaniensis]|uniref:Uncharacterized protein n=1 Tax=Naegleria lovaniensis TaxID=51637 RepID=A0AA88KHM1_NAELO|nr:uncharacterized protein C9374_005726 [Naegleria lovaniensis]KAG2381934.1 hypothetical protein C9374_005726 [Naegleria lovaniensis]